MGRRETSEERDELRALALRLLAIAGEEDGGPEEVPRVRAGPPRSRYTDLRLREVAATVYRLRRKRDDFLDGDMFGEVAWDMLLDLFVMAVDGKEVSTTSLCLAARCPVTTCLRYIDLLEERGLAARSSSDRDARVTYVALTESGRAKMEAYLENALSEADRGGPFMLNH